MDYYPRRTNRNNGGDDKAKGEEDPPEIQPLMVVSAITTFGGCATDW